MKAERRHELQTNSLALWIRWRLPQIWQEHGTKILLALIVVVLAIWVIRWRISAPKQAYSRAQSALSQADQILMRIRGGDAVHDPNALGLIKASQLPLAVKAAMDDSDKPLIQARSFNLLGDYYYELAINRISSDATTRPAGSPVSDQLLADAQTQYEKALAVNVDEGDLKAHARIGLGTVALTRAFASAIRGDPKEWSANKNWQLAIDQFKAVIDDPKAPKAMRDNADIQLKITTRLQQNPVQIAAPGEAAPAPVPITPTTVPSTRPAVSPTTAPAK